MDSFTDLLTGFAPLRLPEIRFLDVIDVLIVAILIYNIIIWIKSTRAWSLSKGLIFVLISFALANFFGFNTVKWIILNSINAGIIAIIVLFQPEIRRALEGIGKNKISFFSDEPRSESTDIIINAVFELARSKIGALILIERDVGLGDHEKTGVALDAIVSRQLIINIFKDKTPLHDGAVIIRQSRVAAAACILPLCQSELSYDLGTRHRAAVGVSEVSDADCIVVSEETGSVSCAKAGKLYKNLSQQELYEMLEHAKSEKTAFWKNYEKI